jgi:hypothetical protein
MRLQKLLTKKFWIATLAFLLGATAATAAEPVTGPLAGTTAAHNTVRQNLNTTQPPVPGAAVQPVPVPPLVNLLWDDTVAATAQTWANGCSLSHDPSTPYGENIAWGTSGFITGPSSAVSWADEVRDPGFNYAANECPTGSPSFPGCGHYTQVAWATTTKVGCGFASCGGTDFVVCRYDPPGNFSVNTTRPYCAAGFAPPNCELGAAPDTDGDGIADNLDNCTLVPNPNQRDTDGDGYGNLCDPDFNGDLTVNINDFNRLKARLNIAPVVDVDTDLDGNGAVNINDFNRLKSFLGKPPGPSGLHP